MFKKIFKDKKNIVIISVLGAFLILGITYALINWTSNNYSVAIRSSCMNINYSKGQDIDTNINVIDDSQFINENSNTLTVSPAMVFSTVSIGIDDACSDVKGFATLEINVSNLSNELKSDGLFAGSLKYVVVEYDPSDYNNLDMTELEDDTFAILARGSLISNGVIDIYNTFINYGESHDYLIFFYADNRLIASNFVSDLSFDCTIGSRVEQFIGTSINNFTYSLSGSNILLNKYNGNSSVVAIPSVYKLDGIEYNTVIFNEMFKDNNYVEEVYFEDGVSASNNSVQYIFQNCSKLKKVVNLPDTITNMTGAFGYCTSLVNAPIMPSSTTDMSGTFYGCTSLKIAPTIPNSVTNMTNTFLNCISLENAPEIPDSVKNMVQTFSGCRSLKNVSAIGNSVTDMNYCFRGCLSLINAPVIPSSVMTMEYTFYGCKSLANAPVIPNSTTSMAGTFRDCTSLKSAPTIPNSVTNMNYSFSGCTNLEGTIRINSSNVGSWSYSTVHPFYNTTKSITVEVPSESTTYTNIIKNLPTNVTIVTY